MRTSGPTTAPAGSPSSPRGPALSALLVVLALSVLPADVSGGESGGVCFREDFVSLESWKPLTFPRITRHSVYSIEKGKDQAVLRAESDASASGVVWLETFDIYECPRIRWRWKADRVYVKGDASRKSGDDYPLRIYVLFPYDASRAGIGDRIRYGAARVIYGEYPPLAALNYIWASREQGEEAIPNAYTERSMMIVTRGPADVGRWFTEEADVLEDYRRSFGEDPPPRAGLAVMNDSDDTGVSAISWIAVIEITAAPL